MLIAMALMHRPKLLIADEPGTALRRHDTRMRSCGSQPARRRRALTLLMVTHNLAVVRRTSDYVMSCRTAYRRHGPVRDIFHAPACLYAASPRGDPAALRAKVQRRQARSIVPVIVAHDMVKRFAAPRRWFETARPAVTAVAQATVSVCRGDIFGIAGESGSGKTTVARMIMGLVPLTSGSIAIDGRPDRGMAQGPRLSPPHPDRLPEPGLVAQSEADGGTDLVGAAHL